MLMAGGKHNLKASEVVSHVLAVVGNRVNCAQFGMDMTVVLLKDVLQVRAYWAQLRPKTWQGMHAPSYHKPLTLHGEPITLFLTKPFRSSGVSPIFPK